MLFTEPLFFAFYALVFSAYWTLRRHAHRKVWLLIASYFFYAAWDWRFCGLILASTLVDFAVGRGLGRSESGRARRAWLLLSLCGNLGLLGFFKYFNFFVESANSVFGALGLGGIRTLHIILPVGISFYTFQTLSYSIDVYRRRIAPVSSFPDFALFVSFFPQLVMGPILRARGFLPQLRDRKRLGDVDVRPLLVLFLIGFVKKACLADNVAPLVDAYFADPGAYTMGSAWLAVLFFVVQVYCDFSGYSDMAIAVAGLLGFRVPTNFDFPFLASNISEFWRRWHISFVSWLRDYVYLSLGGGRRGDRWALVNLMITMLLCGLWHGAGWTFVTWGGLNGLALCVHRQYRLHGRLPAGLGGLLAQAGPLLTGVWFAYTSIFFRAESFPDAFLVSKAFALIESPGEQALDPRLWLAFAPLLAAHWLSHRSPPTRWGASLPAWAFALALGVASALAVAFVRVEYRPFIYFQF